MNKTVYQHCLAIAEEWRRTQYPAENVLAGYFKKNQKLGAKDRQLIGDIIFTYFRHQESINAYLGSKKSGLGNQILCAYTLICQQGVNIAEELLTIVSEEKANLAFGYIAWCQNLSEQTLAARTELPQWLLQKLTHLSETEILSFATQLNEADFFNIRVNTAKAKRDKILTQLQSESYSVTPTPYSPWGIRFARKTMLSKHPLYLNGTIEVQDEGSQLLALIAQPKRNEMVIDFCAGAGGKTLAMAAMMGSTGRIYAMDTSEQRLRNIKPRIERSGVTNITIQQIDHEYDGRIKKLIGKADRVLIDAPCSGIGTLKRHPDLKYRQSPESIEQIKATQQAILEAAVPLLKSGGTLIYATCSILPEENANQVEKFLGEHSEFTLIPMQKILEKCKINLQADLYLNLTPQEHHTDGFFAAVMVKK